MNVTESIKDVDTASKPHELGKVYQPSHFEARWIDRWHHMKLGEPEKRQETFTMLIPPPNVTGSLHLGHSAILSIMDCIARYQRMLGKSVRWVVGTDHAGIATQMVVERQIESEGQTRSQMGREAFLERIWSWKKTSAGTITQQMRRLGISVDWGRERFTMDENFSTFVRETFVRLYQEGKIYRGRRLVYWDTQLQTAVSDLEVEHTALPGFLWSIAYPGSHPEEDMVIATTRPETMFGDVAIAVHPEDPRYAHRIGQKVRIPYTERWIPIIADASIDPSFGTGAVKITPAHDFNDYAIGQRHQLEMINILHANGCLNDQAPAPFCGQDRLLARKALLADLERDGYLRASQEHSLNVPIGDRSHSILEPYLTEQWFIDTKLWSQEALHAAETQVMRFVPEHWINSYRHWLSSPQDWCISRQLWWGHRIPAWYDTSGKVYVASSETEVRAQHGLGADVMLAQDPDVLDTWFSSALWPVETLRDEPHRYPTDVLVTGFDILFFWVARMSMLGLHLMKDVPFKKVLVTGLVRDQQGQKMSKSKGNVLDPIDLIDGITQAALIEKRTHGLMQPKMKERIEKQTLKEFPEGIEAHGTDALRLTLLALYNSGQDIRFDLQRLKSFRNFCNKLWNVTRLIEQKLEQHTPKALPPTAHDQWALACWDHTLRELHEHLNAHRFDRAVQLLQHWGWHQLCDWICEFTKIRLQHEGKDSGSLYYLLFLLDEFLKAAHPFMPFITEELGQFTAQHLGLERSALAETPYPMPQSKILVIPQEIAHCCELISSIRTLRSMMNIPPKHKVHVYLENSQQLAAFTKHLESVQAMAHIADVHFDAPQEPTVSHVGTLGHIRMGVGHLDSATERKRLEHQQAKIQLQIEKIIAKMSKEHYKDRAPLSLQQEDQLALQELEEQLKRLELILSSLS